MLTGSAMLFIEDLGTKEYGTQGKRKRFGLYECPTCKVHFSCATAAVKSGHTTKCRKCSYVRDSNNSNLLRLRFIEKATTTYSCLYSYNNVVYIDALCKVNITCKIHGDWQQTPGEHIRGGGCPKCSYQERKGTTAEFITKAKLLSQSLFDYSSTVYIDAKTKLEVTCATHGSFWVLPHNHLKGINCPGCCHYGFDPTKSATLYYLKIEHNDRVLYKIGITNRTVEERFSTEDLLKISILKLWDYPIGKEAYDREQSILKLHKNLKYIGAPVLQSGNTELFMEDVLGLDFIS